MQADLFEQSLIQFIKARGYTCGPSASNGGGWFHTKYIPPVSVSYEIFNAEDHIAELRIDRDGVQLYARLKDKKEYISHEELTYVLLPRLTILRQDPSLFDVVTRFLEEQARVHQSD